MKRDAKGRFTKALVKAKPQPPTDVRLARKLDRIEQVQQKLQHASMVMLLNALFIAACGACVAIGPLVGSIPIGTVGVIGAFCRWSEYREAAIQYWEYRATYQRLLKGADRLTDKLLVEENIIDSDG